MKLTEKEALGLWCPFARCGFSNLINRRELVGRNAKVIGSDLNCLPNCIASKCMMWIESYDNLGTCGLIRGSW